MLLLFDIDATLITTSKQGIGAMQAAGRELFGADFSIDGVDTAGRLDPLIIAEIFAKNDLAGTEAQFGEFRRSYARHLAVVVSRPGIARALAGVHDLLDHLEDEDVGTLGLLTGNFAETGQLKLRACGIDPARFRVSVWGDEAGRSPPRRTDLPPLAIERYLRAGGSADGVRNGWIVGDTPHDVAAARANGLRCLAVATGQFSTEALRGAGAEVVVSDLADTRRIVDYLSQPARTA